MFIVENARARFSFCEIDFGGGHFHTILRETRRGETKPLKHTDPALQGHAVLIMAEP